MAGFKFSDSVIIEPSRTTSRTWVLDVGVAAVPTIYTEGMPVTGCDKHVVILDAQADVPLTVTVGQRSEVIVELNAGDVVIQVPDDRFITIASGSSNLQDNRIEIAYYYDPLWQKVIAAGDYAAVIRNVMDIAVETPFTVSAGERTKVKIDS